MSLMLETSPIFNSSDMGERGGKYRNHDVTNKNYGCSRAALPGITYQVKALSIADA